MNRNAVWVTLFIATILILLFYHDFILSTSPQTRPYEPIENYTSMNKLPLWNPDINSGMPIWGNPEDLARINILDSALFFVLSFLQPYVPDVHFLYLVLNLLLFSGFMFVFLRQIGLRPSAASLTSILILFIPQFVINIVDGNWTNIMALLLLPAILFFTQLLLEQRKLLWLVLGSFFFAFQLLRASAPITLSTIGLIFILYLVYSLHWRVKSKVRAFMSRGVLCIGMIGFGFLLAAYVYLPFIEFAQHVLLPKSTTFFSFKDLFLYAYPSFNGHLVTSDARFVLYFSVMVLFLAGFAILLRRTWRTYLLFSACIACILVAFAGYWGTLMYAAPFIAMILAGIGLNAILKYRQKTRGSKRSRWLDIYMLIVLGVFSAGFVIFLLNKPGYMHHILRQLPLLTLMDQQNYYQKVLLEGATAFILIGLSFSIIRLYLYEKIHPALFVLTLGLLILVDLWIVDYKLISTRQQSPPELPASVTEKFYQSPELFRIFSTTEHSIEKYTSILGDSKSTLKTYDAVLRRTGLSATDEPGMRNPFFSKYTRLVSRYGDIVEEPIPVAYIDPVLLHFDRTMLDLLNVKYIISYSPVHDLNYAVLYDSSFFVYENTTVLPRAFFVDSVQVLPGRRAIFDAMQEEDFHPETLAFLEQKPPFQVNPHDSNTVEIHSYSPGVFELAVDIKDTTAIVLSEVYYPIGWQATVDGQKSQLYKTNFFLKSIFLLPNAKHVKIEFKPLSFQIGVWMSITGAGLWVLSFFTGLIFFIKRKHSQLPRTR
jgi:hypothetical protein